MGFYDLMALFKIEDRYPDYQERFAEVDNIIGVDVYTCTNDEEDKVGNINTVLVDESGRIRYLVVDIGFWVFRKRVLLPIGRCMDDPKHNRIYVTNFSKEQIESLPEYSDEMVVNFDYEERVRSVYLMPTVGCSAPVEMSAPIERAGIKSYPVTPTPASSTSPIRVSKPKVTAASEPEVNAYDLTPELYKMSDENHHRLQLYEERMVAEKHRQKTGEAIVAKRIETEQAEISVPVQKEKIVIEIESVDRYDPSEHT